LFVVKQWGLTLTTTTMVLPLGIIVDVTFRKRNYQVQLVDRFNVLENYEIVTNHKIVNNVMRKVMKRKFFNLVWK
jgi:hypothetical protein